MIQIRPNVSRTDSPQIMPGGKVKGLTFQQLLLTYNPLVYLPLNDAAGTPVDMANTVRHGPPGGTWLAFTAGSPPPQTITLPDGNHLTYGNPGPTSDGRTCVGWSALSRLQVVWAESADMPMFGVVPNATISVCFWFKAPTTQGHYLYALGGHGSTQTKDIYDGPHPQWQQVVQDSGSNIYATSIDPPTLLDGNWHWVVENWSGNNSQNTPVHIDLYIDGAFYDTNTLNIAGNNYSPWGFNPTGFAFGGDTQSASGMTSMLAQDFAILPGGTNACAPLGASDIAALWAHR